ncbi:MAG: NifU N-terminal domain-containing protein [Acidimicrobiia bacterium]
MEIRAEPTPNPNAMKFTVGVPVGGPGTYPAGSNPDEDWVAALLGLNGVASVFMTADFVTISKTPDASWDSIVPEAKAILESHFGA